MFQVYSVPGLEWSSGFASLGIERVQVLTDGAAVVETQSGIDRQPVPTVTASLTNAAAVTNTPPFMGGIARNRPGTGCPLLSTNLTPVGITVGA